MFFWRKSRLSNAVDYSLALKNSVELGRYSFELEQKRGEGIISQASNMLAAISLFSAGGLMAFPIIIANFSSWTAELFIVFGVCAFFSILSLSFAIFAQWRFKKDYMCNAQQFRDLIYKQIEEYPSQDQYNDQWISQLTSMHASLEKTNNLRVRFIIASMVTFMLSIATIIIASFCFIFCCKEPSAQNAVSILVENLLFL